MMLYSGVVPVCTPKSTDNYVVTDGSTINIALVQRQNCDTEELSTLKVFVQNKGEEGSRMVFYSVGPQPIIDARWVKDDSLGILYPEKLDVRFPPPDDGTANVFGGITVRIYKSDGRS